MGVPAHDERDYAFAKRFNLPVVEVIEPLIIRTDGEDGIQPDLSFTERDAIVAVIKHWSEKKYLGVRWKKTNWQAFVVGGIEQGELPQHAGVREIAEETGYIHAEPVAELGGKVHAQFYQSLQKENRFAHFKPVLFTLKDGEQRGIEKHEKDLHDLVWLTPQDMDAFITHFDMKIIWERVKGNFCFEGEGILTNSGPFTGLTSQEGRSKIVETVEGKLVTVFKLHDWVFSRQRYWGEPIPMIWCSSCGWMPVPEENRPVELPELEKYQPTETGESPLAQVINWVETTCPTCKGPGRRETDVMPNWAGSSWYYLRYADPFNDREFASKEKLTYWTPVDWYNGGMEHTTLHLLYSRFWHKFLYDIGRVPTHEPYQKRTSHGLILAEGGEKMSKSKGNVINPDDIVSSFGADSLRLYEMFLGPFDQPVMWSAHGIIGTRRFVEKVWRFFTTTSFTDVSLSFNDERTLNTAVVKISSDIETLKMNTAVSGLMILLRHLEQAAPSRVAAEVFLKLLSPFAPHVASELWEMLGHSDPLWEAAWPEGDPEKAEGESQELSLQINGKVRGRVSLPMGISEAEALTIARKELSKWLEEAREVRSIYVPGRVINIVVERS